MAVANETIFPFALPLFGGISLLFWTSPSVGRRVWIAFLLLTLLLLEVFFVWHSYQGELFITLVGGWLAPFGISLVIDLLAALFLFFCTFILLCSVLYAFATEETAWEAPLRYPLLFFLLMGVNLSLITGDFFNLFVAFEVMLLSSYALMTLEAKEEALPYAFPYIIMNITGSLLFLTAAGITYGYFGTLNFAQLALYMRDPAHMFYVQLIALFSLCIFGLKAAVFPLYFWLPNSYPILPTPLAAIYAGILTKVGIYVLIRLFASVFPPHVTVAQNVLLGISAVTMLLGVLGAIAQETIKKILSYHIISQIGFMILAIGLGSPAAIAAAIVYTLHNVIVKASLFLLGGSGALVYGTDTLKKMGHLWGLLPFIGFLFLLQAFSLAGVPPLSGFWAKYLVVLETLRSQHYILAGIAVLTGWLTLFSMLKIWSKAFWGEQKARLETAVPYRRRLGFCLALPAALSLLMGFGAQGMISLAEVAALQATDRDRIALALFPLLDKSLYRYEFSLGKIVPRKHFFPKFPKCNRFKRTLVNFHSLFRKIELINDCLAQKPEVSRALAKPVGAICTCSASEALHCRRRKRHTRKKPKVKTTTRLLAAEQGVWGSLLHQRGRRERSSRTRTISCSDKSSDKEKG